MTRQSKTPIQFQYTTRPEGFTVQTSGRAGKQVPITYFPLLRGDSCSGRVGLDFKLNEMPKALLNTVQVNVQAWFVPKSAHPQFSGMDEFVHSYQGKTIKAKGQLDRVPPVFYEELSTAQIDTIRASEMFKSLGIHIPLGHTMNTDLIDAFLLVHNFRLAAHSDRLTLREYASENLLDSVKLPPAFWPVGRFTHVVPDYESGLITGSLSLDVTSGQIPVVGDGASSMSYVSTNSAGNQAVLSNAPYAKLLVELAGQQINTSLADIDKARETVAFAKMRQAMKGSDTTGYKSDDVMISEMMQGFPVSDDQQLRPWLLDSQIVTFGMDERHATDAANLDVSITDGGAQVNLSLNVPRTASGGYVVVIADVLPQRVLERQSDEHLLVTDVNDLPDALRDSLRLEPVDHVTNREIDALHANPDGLYGYDGMNAKWKQRGGVRLGGVFFEPDPLLPPTEARAGLWEANIIDPEYTQDHFLVPVDFPHDVFSDQAADAFEVTCTHNCQITGLTQFYRDLEENSDDYQGVVDHVEGA